MPKQGVKFYKCIMMLTYHNSIFYKLKDNFFSYSQEFSTSDQSNDDIV